MINRMVKLNFNLYDNIISKMQNYYYNLEDMNISFNNLETKLKALTELNKHDKLSFDTSLNIYIDSGHMFQFIKRWYYDENCKKTYENIQIYLNDYESFLQMVLGSLYNNNTTLQHIEFSKRVKDYNKELLNGLKNLHETYLYELNKYDVSDITDTEKEIKEINEKSKDVIKYNNHIKVLIELTNYLKGVIQDIIIFNAKVVNYMNLSNIKK